jgi:molybdopterin adenylyltransferase
LKSVKKKMPDSINPAADTCGILTISDKGSIGERKDTSGPELKKIINSLNFQVVKYLIIPDQHEQISKVLKKWSDEENLALILTTGGTGVSPSDQTPEATKQVIEKEIPGICEMMRFQSFKKTPNALLSRAVAGIRKQSLIINLPGSLRGARENLEVILPCLEHAIYKIQGGKKDCGEN